MQIQYKLVLLIFGVVGVSAWRGSSSNDISPTGSRGPSRPSFPSRPGSMPNHIPEGDSHTSGRTNIPELPGMQGGGAGPVDVTFDSHGTDGYGNHPGRPTPHRGPHRPMIKGDGYNASAVPSGREDVYQRPITMNLPPEVMALLKSSTKK